MATFPYEIFLESPPKSFSITTPSLIEIMALSLLIEPTRELICFSKRISRYADAATGRLSDSMIFLIFSNTRVEEILQRKYDYHSKVKIAETWCACMFYK